MVARVCCEHIRMRMVGKIQAYYYNIVYIMGHSSRASFFAVLSLRRVESLSKAARLLNMR